MVELRSRSHLHYIRAIKDGRIKPVMYVTGLGKSKLRYRQLVDIYNSENIRGCEATAKIQPRVLRESEHGSEKAKAPPLAGAEVNVKPELEDFDMTLEKVWKQCKEKKRKRKDCRDAETASDVEVKQETLENEGEGCDLEEPLSMWNTKFSKKGKKKKKKKKQKTKCGSTSSTSVKKVCLPVLCDVKPEPCEDISSVSEAMDFNLTDSFLDCKKEQESPTNTESMEETICDSSKDTRLDPYCNTEPSPHGMLAIEENITTTPVDKTSTDASEEFVDARKTQCRLADNIVLENQENGLQAFLCGEQIEFEVPWNSQSASIISCVPISSYSSSGCKEVTEDEENSDSGILETDYSSLPALDFEVENTEIVKIEAPQVVAVGVENAEIVWEAEDIAHDDLPEVTDIIQLANCFSSQVHLHSLSDDSAVPLEEQHKAPDEVTTDAETDGIQQQNQHKEPEKLLSGRKALSPTSQAKLIKAMEHPDSPEKRSKKPKVKLYFSSKTSHRVLKAQGLDNIDRVDVIPNSKQAIQRANGNTRQTHYPRATRKFPRRVTQATKPQPFGSGCASLQGCTQKAIDFSQGQIRDFRCVAARLTEEIKSLRQITKTCLLADNNITSNMSEDDLKEVKTFVKHAERTEENSKKWLSMIERDCNRFCKVMGMVTEDSSPATENIVQKKKKIKFADDAGGDLCHVKVFED